MNVNINEGVLEIESEGIVLELKIKGDGKKLSDLISISIKADNIVSEVQNEIDMNPTTIVSGKFVTGAFYGLNNDGYDIFISRDTVTFNPNIFNLVEEKVQLPFYAITNRYSMNSVSKKYYQFAKVFSTQDEMMKVYRNTVKYLKFKNVES
jgi:hypothetical protein